MVTMHFEIIFIILVIIELNRLLVKSVVCLSVLLLNRIDVSWVEIYGFILLMKWTGIVVLLILN